MQVSRDKWRNLHFFTAFHLYVLTGRVRIILCNALHFSCVLHWGTILKEGIAHARINDR